MLAHRCLAYAAIWKSGSAAIRTSLMSVPGLLRRQSPPRMLADKIDTATVMTLRGSRFCHKGLFSFTFVREPLSHFLAGFGEYCARELRRLPHITTARAQATVLDIVEGRRPRGDVDVAHMFPMSGVLAAGWTFNLVGRLETSSADWKRLASAFEAVASLPFNSTVASHPSSLDGQGARTAMREVLRGDDALRKRICTCALRDRTCACDAATMTHNGAEKFALESVGVQFSQSTTS